MTTINRAPLGLLGFLGIKNFGRNPEAMSGVLAPTWPLDRLYLASSATIGPVVTSALSIGVNSVWTVPQNEVWWVESVSVRSTAALGAGSFIRLQVLTIDQGANVVQPRGGNSIAFQAAEFIFYGNSDGYYVMPGSEIGFGVIGSNIADVLTMEIKRTVMAA